MDHPDRGPHRLRRAEDPMTRGKRRPQSERTMALVVAAVDGVQAASEATGIPHQTISEWTQSEEFGELRRRKKEDVDAEWWAGIQAYQRSIMEDLHSAPLRDKVGAFAIMFEKWSLLSGNPTARTENRTFTDQFEDHEQEALREAINRELVNRETAGDESGPALESPPSA